MEYRTAKTARIIERCVLHKNKGHYEMEYDGKDGQEYPLMGWSEYLAAKEPIAQTGGQNDGHCLQSGVVLHQG